MHAVKVCFQNKSFENGKQRIVNHVVWPIMMKTSRRFNVFWVDHDCSVVEHCSGVEHHLGRRDKGLKSTDDMLSP